MKNRKKINIVWFKRDLRTQDHYPLHYAEKEENDYLCIYIYDPKKIAHESCSLRHLQFVYHSINDINNDLQRSNKITINKLLSKNDDTILKIDFLNCNSANVTVSSFLSYYNLSTSHETTQILKDITIDTYDFTASEDVFAPKTHSKISKINNANVKLIQIDGSDHFFRDLYLDEVVDNLTDFIE